MPIDKDYLNTIRERMKTNRIHKKFQMVGLMIAEILQDDKHKALYMRLAKKHNEQDLIILARDVAERRSIQNKGAYFMKVLQSKNEELKKAKDLKTAASAKATTDIKALARKPASEEDIY